MSQATHATLRPLGSDYELLIIYLPVFQTRGREKNALEGGSPGNTAACTAGFLFLYVLVSVSGDTCQLCLAS